VRTQTTTADVHRLECPLPLRALGFVESLWVKSSLAGLLASTGLAGSPVALDAYRICDAVQGNRLYRITLSRAEQTAGGCSTISASDALLKAFGELCEVVQILDGTQPLGKTRNGVAADTNEDVARKRAYCELVERDSLITHFLCPEVRSFPLSQPSYALLPARFAELWCADPGVKVVLAGIQDDTSGPWFLGAGASETVDAALKKAYLESVSVYCGYRNAATSGDLLSRRNKEVWKHIQASKSPAMGASIRSIFDGCGASTPDFGTSISFASFNRIATFRDRWLVVAASHRSLCQLAFGQLWNESKEPILAVLTSRKLAPTWDLHPFA
jgi:YcaO cyclodehydratase, ATP-ad Mg2+-binding